MGCEQRSGTFVDPRLAKTDGVGVGTWAKYDSHLRDHILPRFGEMALGEVNRLSVKAWVKALGRSLAEPTVKDVMTLLSMILGESLRKDSSARTRVAATSQHR